MAEKPITEAEAAERLGISKATLARERLAGHVHPIRIGQRIIRYTDSILDEYLRQCRNTPAKAATSGYPSDRGRTTGAAPGTTPTPDRRDAHLLAQQTFRKAS